jgi:hypothetical protein
MPSTVSAMGRTAMRLAYAVVSRDKIESVENDTYIFDVRAGVDGDNITVLDPQVVANDSVYPRRAIVEIVVCEHNQDCILALLALDQYGVTAEELERLHGVVRERDNRVVIIHGIGNAGGVSWALLGVSEGAHINEFGFFFFFRIAVAVSSFCGGSAIDLGMALGDVYVADFST